MDSRARKKFGISFALSLTGILVLGGLAALFYAMFAPTATEAATAPASAADTASCAIEGIDFNAWAGKPASEAEAIVKQAGRPYRILGPDSAATMDYSAERINIMQDDNAVVTEVTCG